MLAMLVAYAFSGTFSVGSNEVALRLRFGDYVGQPGARVLERGTYLAAPFPIEQVVKVDTRPATVALEKEFWFETKSQESGLTRSQLQALKALPLHPLRDGSSPSRVWCMPSHSCRPTICYAALSIATWLSASCSDGSTTCARDWSSTSSRSTR
jgi:hypothetical protein